jgi:hypothetical protein
MRLSWKKAKPNLEYALNARVIVLTAILVALVSNMHTLHAQSVEHQPRFGGGAHFLLGFPQGDFKDNLDRIGGGITGEFLGSLRPAPIKIGISVGFLIYGSETRVEPFSTTIPEVTVDVTTTNNILLGHLLLRVQPAKGVFRPYVDGLLGFNYLFTQTKIESGELQVAESTNFDDFAFSYGGGTGIMIKVYDGSRKKKTKDFHLAAVLIDARVRYLKGSEAEYLQEGSIRTEGTEVIYDVSESNTDLLTVQIGAIAEF